MSFGTVCLYYKKLLCLAGDSDDDVDEVVRVGMVRLSVGMQLEVPTTDLTSLRDPFEDTNRLHFQHWYPWLPIWWRGRVLVDKTKDDNYVFLMDWDADKILSFTHICFRGAFVKILIVMIMVITTKSIQRFLSVFFRNCIHTHPKCVTHSACMVFTSNGTIRTVRCEADTVEQMGRRLMWRLLIVNTIHR